MYTILSRTSSILIITLFNDPDTPKNNTQEVYKEAIGLLRRDRIIFWDQETKDAFEAYCQHVQFDVSEDDEEE